MSAAEDRAKGAHLKAAARWLHEVGGKDATLEAFGDAEDLNRAWYALDVEGFRAYLWERCKTALEALEKGAA